MTPQMGQPARCPQCGSSRVLPFIHGRPSDDGFRAIDEGRALPGYCMAVPTQHYGAALTVASNEAGSVTSYHHGFENRSSKGSARLRQARCWSWRMVGTRTRIGRTGCPRWACGAWPIWRSWVPSRLSSRFATGIPAHQSYASRRCRRRSWVYRLSISRGRRSTGSRKSACVVARRCTECVLWGQRLQTPDKWDQGSRGDNPRPPLLPFRPQPVCW
jgi:hypothetical protein